MQIGLLSDKLLYSTPDIRVFAIHTTNNCKYPARYLILDKTGVVMICKICGKEFVSSLHNNKDPRARKAFRYIGDLFTEIGDELIKYGRE